MSKGLWEPRTLPTNQPWPGGRCSGEAFSPEDWASTSWVRRTEKKGSWGQWGEGVMRERTGQQEPRVRPKSEEGPGGPSSVS